MTQAKYLCYYSTGSPLTTIHYVTSVKMLFDVSQIEFLLHALQVRLRGMLDLVIIFEPCSCSTGCSKGH